MTLKMKKNILFIYFSIVSSFISINAQKKIEQQNSNELILQATFQSYDKQYEEAIETFQKVSINDTNYSNAQLQIANCYFLQEQFSNAQNVLNELLELEIPYRKKHIAYKLLGLAYEKDGKFNQAVKTYNKGIELYPYHFGLYVNRGVAYENAKQFDLAVADFKKAIQLNPSFAGTHFHLGKIITNHHLYSEGILSLLTYILIEPNTDLARQALNIIEDIASGSYSPEYENNGEILGDETLENLNTMIDNKEHLGVTTNYFITNETTQLLDKLINSITYSKQNSGFWNQFYIKFYEQIKKDQKLAELIRFVHKPSENPSTFKKANKKQKKHDQFIAYAQKIWDEKNQFQHMEFEGKIEHVLVSYNESGFEAFGKYNDKDEPIGKWYYYHPNGALNIIAQFNDKSQKEGKWLWYNMYNGKLENDAVFFNDSLEGFAHIYYYTGEMSEKKFFKKDELEDTVFSYFRSGDISEKFTVKEGKKNGDYMTYYENGQLQSKYSLKDDLANGKYEEYYANGILMSEFTLVEDKIEGVKTEYFPNKQKKFEANYINNELNGTVKSWYANGQLEEEMNYKNDIQIGQFSSYYSTGQLKSTGELDETGKQNGTITFYDLDGKKYEENIYKKGILTEVKAINKDGKTFFSSTLKNNQLDYKGYYPNGNIQLKGIFLNDQRTGKWEYFDRYGNIETIEYYEDGLLVDTAFNYFANGNLQSKTTYEEGVKNGMYLEFNIFDTLVQEGFYSNDELDRDWYIYNAKGKLSGEYFYNEGWEQGIQRTYATNGKLANWKEIELGKVVSQIYLDTNENKVDEFAQFHGEVKIHDALNKYIQFKGTYKNGLANGIATWYFPNGKIEVSGNYINDERDGIWSWYDEKGTLLRKIEYLFGLENGASAIYYENGILKEEFNYSKGEIQGLYKEFHINGKIAAEINFLDGKRHGKATYYDLFGNIIMYRYYDQNVFVSYSYLDKDKQEIQPIALTTGKNHILTYFPNGTISSDHHRENGLIEGKYITYNLNGSKIVEVDHKNGEFHGAYIEYDEKGNRYHAMNYFVGQLDGLEEYFFNNGKINIQNHYSLDLKHGLKTIYDVNGKIIHQYKFYNDELIEILK